MGSLSPLFPPDQIETQLLSSPALKATLSDNPSLRRMWPLVLAELSGRPAWAESARRALTRTDFVTAAKLVEHVGNEERSALLDLVVGDWGRFREDIDQQLADIGTQVQALEGAGLNGKSVQEWLSLARDEADKLPPARIPADPTDTLGALDVNVILDAKGYLREARATVEALRGELDRRREETREEARKIKRKIDERVDDLVEILDHAAKGLLKRALPVVLFAWEMHDVSRLTAIQHVLERLAAGDHEPLSALIAQNSANDESPADDAARRKTPSTLPPQRGSVSSSRESHHGTTFGTRLSALAEARFAAHRSTPADGVEATKLLSEVLKLWSGPELSKHVSKAAGMAVRRNTDWDVALLAACLGQAKALLLDGDLSQSQALFADGLTTALSLTRLSDVERFRDTAAWGVLVTLLLMYLPEEDRGRTLDPVNLSMLFYRRIGELPLRLVDDLNLLGALGGILATMEVEPAEYFFRDYLKPYLKDRPVATSELARGLFSAPQSDPGAALRVLSMLLREVELLPSEAERVDAALVEILSLPGLRADNIWWETVGRLRQKLGGLSGENETLKRVEEAVAVLYQRQSARAAKGPRLAPRLLTPTPQTAENPYVVLEVLNQDPAQSVRGLRVDAAVVDPTERIEQKAPTRSAPAEVAPDDRAEIVISVPRPAGWPDSARLRVRFSTPTLHGTFAYEPASSESFALKPPTPERAPREKPKNPYAVGGALSERSEIVGRESEIEKIIRALIGAKRDNVVVVLGERRMGKTTVLNAVEKEAEIAGRYGSRVVRIDVQDVPLGERAADFFLNRVVGPIVRKLTSVGGRAPIVRERFFEKSPYEAFKQFMLDLDEGFGKQPVLIVIDELEKLLTVIEQQDPGSPEAIGSEAMASLRAVMMRAKNLSFILAGVTDVLRRHTTQHANRLFRLGIEVEVKGLPREAAEALVEQPCRVAYEVLPAARDIVVGLTGRQPYLVQYICHHLFEHMVRTGATFATRTDVEAIVERDILKSARLFEHFVEAVPDATDAELVRALGALQRGDDTVPVTAIARHLTRGGTSLSEEEVAKRLILMRERTPAVVDDTIRQPGRFRLTVGLYARRLRLLQRDPHGLVVRTV